jgi:hypothetical protein
MARPTVQNVYDLARSFLGDDDISGGQDFQNALLQNHLQAAYRDMLRILVNMEIERAQTEAFYNLPANTMALDPATAGIIDLGDIIGVEERGSANSLTVTAAQPNTPGTAQLQITTSTAHGLTSGNPVVVYGLNGLSDYQGTTMAFTGLYAGTVIDSFNYALNGATCTGTYTSGGVLSYSTEDFVPLGKVDQIDLSMGGNAPQQMLNFYAFEGHYFRFLPCSQVRQLRIVYYLSGDCPTATTAIIPIDDSVDYLALQTAYRAALARDLTIAEELKASATWVIGNLGNIGVRNLQELQRRRPPFRPHRSNFALW